MPTILHFIGYVTPCRKLLLHHTQNGTDIIVLFPLMLKTPSIHLQLNSTYHVALLTDSHSFIPDSQVLTVSKCFAAFRNTWQSYWDPWAKFCISSSNTILNSGCLSKFIEVRGRNLDVLSKQKKPNTMMKGCSLILLSKISQRDILWHGIHCVLPIEELNSENQGVLLGV